MPFPRCNVHPAQTRWFGAYHHGVCRFTPAQHRPVAGGPAGEGRPRRHSRECHARRHAADGAVRVVAVAAHAAVEAQAAHVPSATRVDVQELRRLAARLRQHCHPAGGDAGKHSPARCRSVSVQATCEVVACRHAMKRAGTDSVPQLRMRPGRPVARNGLVPRGHYAGVRRAHGDVPLRKHSRQHPRHHDRPSASKHAHPRASRCRGPLQMSGHAAGGRRERVGKINAQRTLNTPFAFPMTWSACDTAPTDSGPSMHPWVPEAQTHVFLHPPGFRTQHSDKLPPTRCIVNSPSRSSHVPQRQWTWSPADLPPCDACDIAASTAHQQRMRMGVRA